ncbi:S41 family peptidase [Candidatus Peregrinibacteria bacterium]|nr:S41 family peptidase [Candidatus Peregrinibacteria bacterium]
MKKTLHFLFGLTIVLQGLAFNANAAFGAFADVPASHRYVQDINSLQENGVVSDADFQPDAKITRGDFVMWLLRNAGFKDENYKPRTKQKFIDVKKTGNPYYSYIYKLVDLGVPVTKGVKNPLLFNPNGTITRKEALDWIFNINGIPVPRIFEEAQFQATDVNTKSDFAPLINKAIALGLLSPGKVKPNAKLTRGEVAHYLKLGKNATPQLTVTIMPSMDSGMVRNSKYDIMIAAWNRIMSTYLRKDSLNQNNVIYGAIDGMVKELGDKHSDFERPGDNALLDSLSGEVEGIGAVLQMKDEQVVIISPIVGSPAEAAGLLSNDVITAVDGTDVKGLKLSEVAGRIRGTKGTQVKVTIKRGDKTLNFTITRDIVKIASVTSKRTADNVLVINLNDFGAHTTDELKKIVDEVNKNKPSGIILDMRNNPGGFLNTAVEIGGFFIKSGNKVVSIKYPDHEETENSAGNADFEGIKLVVVVNGGSASAAEILAGALQDYGLAKIIGEKTYGKGTVQELSDFSDGSTLKITVAEWLTPKGHSIEKNGITPDIEVKMTDEDRAAKRDPQLDRALEEVKK